MPRSGANLQWLMFLAIGALLQLAEGLSVSDCGIQPLHDKIVNGNETAIDEYPWMALFRFHNRQRNVESWGCSGTYVGGKTVVTAAHCVDNAAINSLGDLKFIRLGEYDTSKELDCVDTEDGQDCADPPIDFLVARILIHPSREHDRESKENDVALVILNTQPPYTDFIRPICLPISNEIKDHKRKLYVAGWGWTVGFYPSPSTTKQQIGVNAVNHTICKDHYKGSVINEDTQICAGGEKGSNPCRGDSGGPLMSAKHGDEWTLIGIVSYGPKVCAIQGFDERPTIFTNVYYFLPWINANAV